jgi:16S rRNA (cytidine1402-2'-O)-methyltransferase
MIFYESPRRIVALLHDVVAVIGANRGAVVARELTKLHETVLRGNVGELLERIETDGEQQLGEIVLLLAGCEESAEDAAAIDVRIMLTALLKRMPLKEAVTCAAEFSAVSRNELYRVALALSSG